MKFLSLILKSARRSKRRTVLTILSVALAVFLFAALRAVLDGFNAATEGSSSTRIVTIRSTSLIFSMPTSHANGIRNTAGVQDITWANWFGGIYKDPQNFFAQFAVEPESYLRMYPEITLTPDQKQAFLDDRTGCIVGDGLARRFGWKLGDRIVLRVGIPTYGTQDYDFTIRGIYRASGSAVDNQSMMFNWKYADERSIQKGQVGWYVIKIDSPDHAPQIASAIDQQFANTPYETKTDTEKQFQSSFASMFGNLNLAAWQHRAGRRDHHAVRCGEHDGDVGSRADHRDCRHAHARLPGSLDFLLHRGRRAVDLNRRRCDRCPAGLVHR